MEMTTEKKVGLFFLLALIGLGVMIERVEDWNPLAELVAYHAYFDSAVGIREGDPVRLAGVEVGKVKTIAVDRGRVRIDFTVEEGTPVRQGTIAEIRQANLLGGQFLGLTLTEPEAPRLEPGSTIPSRPGASIDELISSLQRNQERVLGALGDLVEESREPLLETVARLEVIFSRIESGEGTLGRLINDPQLYEDTRSTMAGLQRMVGRLDRGEGTLGRLFTEERLYDELAAAATDLRTVLARIRAGEGSLGRLLQDDRLYEEVRGAAGEFREVAARINRGEGTLGKLVADDSLYLETREAMSSLASIAKKIDQGEGTLGLLVNKDDLYRDAQTTLHKVERTVDGISDSGPLTALGVVVGTLF